MKKTHDAFTAFYKILDATQPVAVFVRDGTIDLIKAGTTRFNYYSGRFPDSFMGIYNQDVIFEDLARDFEHMARD